MGPQADPTCQIQCAGPAWCGHCKQVGSQTGLAQVCCAARVLYWPCAACSTHPRPARVGAVCNTRPGAATICTAWHGLAGVGAICSTHPRSARVGTVCSMCPELAKWIIVSQGVYARQTDHMWYRPGVSKIQPALTCEVPSTGLKWTHTLHKMITCLGLTHYMQHTGLIQQAASPPKLGCGDCMSVIRT